MIAEIKDKLSEVEGKEDELTGNFFGCMRYIPYNKGLKPILDEYAKSDNDEEFKEKLKKLEADDAENFKIEFWKKFKESKNIRSAREIDALMTVGNVVVGIEVKLNSDVSGKEEEGKDKKDKDQLRSYGKLISEYEEYSSKDKLLLFVARRGNTYSVYENNWQELRDKGVHLGYICWEDILHGLDELKTSKNLNEFEKRIIEDLIALLKHKGFSDFQNFYIDVYVDKEHFYCFGLDGKTSMVDSDGFIGFQNFYVDVDVYKEQFYCFNLDAKPSIVASEGNIKPSMFNNFYVDVSVNKEDYYDFGRK